MLPLATLDLETDPFEYGKRIYPFVSGYYDGSKFVSVWGSDCIERTVANLSKEPPHTIYIHNGGKFDLFFFMRFLSKGSLRIINGRIVECNISSADSDHPHVIRDSYSIMPFALREYDKDQIDYEVMRPATREKHKDAIIKYLKKDCTSLHELVTAFVAEFGDKLTIGSAALAELKKFHKFETLGPFDDAKFRKSFYFGGRVQCFETGIIERPLQILDVNSMYPYVMKSYLHPVGRMYDLDVKVTKQTYFVVAEGKNYGAFPVRTEKNSLDFTLPSGKFCTTIHEWNAALETGAFKPARIVKTFGFDHAITFAEFVDHFYELRKHAKITGDKIHSLFYKFVLNSAYGKFAQNPENFFDWIISEFMQPPEGYEIHSSYQDAYSICQKAVTRLRYNNVATGASITGAARSVLLRGIHAARNVIYCDTDSIICNAGANGLSIDPDTLGAWKLEENGDCAAIAGKKLYAVFRDGKCVKKAHKGGRLTGEEIVKIAQGETVEKSNDVPAFKWASEPGQTTDGKMVWIKRRFRKT